jgi:hypothetical protein
VLSEVVTGQVKVIASDDTIARFKRVVLAKGGKLSAEGEEALRLYIKKYENLPRGLCPPERDPLAKICGIGKSSICHNVLKDLEKLETESS